MAYELFYGGPTSGMGEDLFKGAKRQETFSRRVANAEMMLQKRRQSMEEARTALQMSQEMRRQVEWERTHKLDISREERLTKTEERQLEKFTQDQRTQAIQQRNQFRAAGGTLYKNESEIPEGHIIQRDLIRDDMYWGIPPQAPEPLSVAERKRQDIEQTAILHAQQPETRGSAEVIVLADGSAITVPISMSDAERDRRRTELNKMLEENAIPVPNNDFTTYKKQWDEGESYWYQTPDGQYWERPAQTETYTEPNKRVHGNLVRQQTQGIKILEQAVIMERQRREELAEVEDIIRQQRQTLENKIETNRKINTIEEALEDMPGLKAGWEKSQADRKRIQESIEAADIGEYKREVDILEKQISLVAGFPEINWERVSLVNKKEMGDLLVSSKAGDREARIKLEQMLLKEGASSIKVGEALAGFPLPVGEKDRREIINTFYNSIEDRGPEAIPITENDINSINWKLVEKGRRDAFKDALRDAAPEDILRWTEHLKDITSIPDKDRGERHIIAIQMPFFNWDTVPLTKQKELSDLYLRAERGERRALRMLKNDLIEMVQDNPDAMQEIQAFIDRLENL